MRGITSWPISAAVAVLALGATLPEPAFSQKVLDLVVVDVVAVSQGLRASKLVGTSVVNDQNEKIGTLDDLIIDRDKVLFTVLNVGGFLGIGSHLVAVPFASLNVDYGSGKIILAGATKDALKKLPEFKYG